MSLTLVEQVNECSWQATAEQAPQLAHPPVGLVTPLCSLVYAIKSVNSLTEREKERRRRTGRRDEGISIPGATPDAACCEVNFRQRHANAGEDTQPPSSHLPPSTHAHSPSLGPPLVAEISKKTTFTLSRWTRFAYAEESRAQAQAGDRPGQAGPGRDPGSEIKSFLKDISYNFTLSRHWTWTLQVVCLVAAKEIGKKPRKNTRERKVNWSRSRMGHRGQAAVTLPTCQRKLLKKDDNSRKKAEGRTRKKEGRRKHPSRCLSSSFSLLRRICMRLLNQLLLNIYFSTVHFSRGALAERVAGGWGVARHIILT